MSQSSTPEPEPPKRRPTLPAIRDIFEHELSLPSRPPASLAGSGQLRLQTSSSSRSPYGSPSTAFARLELRTDDDRLRGMQSSNPSQHRTSGSPLTAGTLTTATTISSRSLASPPPQFTSPFVYERRASEATAGPSTLLYDDIYRNRSASDTSTLLHAPTSYYAGRAAIGPRDVGYHHSSRYEGVDPHARRIPGSSGPTDSRHGPSSASSSGRSYMPPGLPAAPHSVIGGTLPPQRYTATVHVQQSPLASSSAHAPRLERAMSFNDQGYYTSMTPTAPGFAHAPLRRGSEATVSSAAKGGRYECEYCHRGFNRPSSLRIHLNTHTGERPFQCPVEGCGRSFSVLSNMRRHARVHNNPPRSRRGSRSSDDSGRRGSRGSSDEGE